MVQNEPLDDEYQALLSEKKPYWATVIALGDPVEVCNDDPFFDRSHAAVVVATIRANKQRAGLTANCAAAITECRRIAKRSSRRISR